MKSKTQNVQVFLLKTSGAIYAARLTPLHDTLQEKTTRTSLRHFCFRRVPHRSMVFILLSHSQTVPDSAMPVAREFPCKRWWAALQFVLDVHSESRGAAYCRRAGTDRGPP